MRRSAIVILQELRTQIVADTAHRPSRSILDDKRKEEGDEVLTLIDNVVDGIETAVTLTESQEQLLRRHILSFQNSLSAKNMTTALTILAWLNTCRE